MQNLKLRQLFLLATMLFLFFTNGMAQYKSYRLNADGDTLNAIDQKDMRQGKWVIKVEPLRGEPGYEEEGVFKNNNKESRDSWKVSLVRAITIMTESHFLRHACGCALCVLQGIFMRSRVRDFVPSFFSL